MFTGLIEEMGVIRRVFIDPTKANQTLFEIFASIVLENVALGDSIAVNGVCLTVTAFVHEGKDKKHSNYFTVGLSPETLRRTNLGDLKEGDQVNLERSMSANGKFGGHFVQAHVDGVAEMIRKYTDGDMLVLSFRPLDASLLMYIVEKGYIAIDGTSLTVTRVDDISFDVMLIQYTQTKIVQAKKNVGERVNIEVDILGKYFVNFMQKFGQQMQKKQQDAADSKQIAAKL